MIELHTRREIAEMLGLSFATINGYFSHMSVKPKAFKRVGAVRSGLYFAPEIKFLIEQRKETTRLAKLAAAEKMQKAATEKRRNGTFKQKEKMDMKELPFEARVKALRANGLSVGKIAKLENKSVVEIWQLIMKLEK